MPREGFNLKKEEVKDIIYKETEKHNISIDDKGKELVERIVASCPSSPNTAYLLRWCNNEVSKELNSLPDLNEDILEIRNNVGKELRYKLDQERFKELIERINLEKPKVITPEWIRGRFYALSLSIRRGYKNLDGTIDWDFIANKLGITDRFSIQKKEYWNNDKEKIIGSLKSFLEKEKPLVFSPNWIYENNIQISHQIVNNFRTEDDRVDWDTVISLLDENWQQRWNNFRSENSPRERNMPILELAENVIRLFEKEKPIKISPTWIAKKLPNDYAVILKRISGENKEIKNWQFFIDLLPSDIAKKWVRRKNIKELLPENLYSDPEETDTIVQKHENDMHTLYVLLDKENDKEKREKIITDFKKIIDKGNVDALNRLTEHLTFTVDGWIENNYELKFLQYSLQDVKKVIERCIHRYSNSGAFFTYLYTSLKGLNLKIKEQMIKDKDYEKKYVDGNIEYHREDAFKDNLI